ncbi:lipase family protein [Paenibacillus sambharensis]|uniref:Lipase family protein n=1 Tax=Paenibacillus sambharensis TaxID=1803190 RepID=A0A2W1L5Y8_9BACL|nr:lipase family protein [Paenibacillus sambharensis]PZD94686.1 lipase family protein [Paenibacillus sambharensis]
MKMTDYGSWSGQTALLLAAVCGQTYVQFTNADGTFLMPDGFTLAAAIKGKTYGDLEGCFGFVLESADKVIVAFRGTITVSDWIADLDAKQVRYRPVRDGGLTHAGFTAIYMSMREQLKKSLAPLMDGRQLYVTGHSLGGALAVLAAPDIAGQTSGRPPVIYTFGAPRTGDPAFARMFNRTITHMHRVYNPRDVVPHVPPFLYTLPRSQKLYYYVHVKGGRKLSFNNGSISANHILDSYFQSLAGEEPGAVKAVCGSLPGFCPVPG